MLVTQFCYIILSLSGSEQKSIRDTWIKAKNENSKEAKASKTKELIEITSPDIKSAIDNSLISNGYKKDSTEFDRVKLKIIERVNAEGITKPSEALKEANRYMLFGDQNESGIAYDEYAAYLTPIPFVGDLYKGVKDAYNYFAADENEQVRLIDIERSALKDSPLRESDSFWSSSWGEKPSNAEWDGNSGGWKQWSTNIFYDALTGQKMRLVPSEPEKRPGGIPADAVWDMIPDRPTYGWYWSQSEQKGYNAAGFEVTGER